VINEIRKRKFRKRRDIDDVKSRETRFILRGELFPRILFSRRDNYRIIRKIDSRSNVQQE
jgi:hypothetical protein